jgi:hypothetical protein
MANDAAGRDGSSNEIDRTTGKRVRITFESDSDAA